MHGHILFLYFSNRKSCLASKHVYIAEVRTIAKITSIEEMLSFISEKWIQILS